MFDNLSIIMVDLAIGIAATIGVLVVWGIVEYTIANIQRRLAKRRAIPPKLTFHQIRKDILDNLKDGPEVCRSSLSKLLNSDVITTDQFVWCMTSINIDALDSKTRAALNNQLYASWYRIFAVSRDGNRVRVDLQTSVVDFVRSQGRFIPDVYCWDLAPYVLINPAYLCWFIDRAASVLRDVGINVAHDYEHELNNALVELGFADVVLSIHPQFFCKSFVLEDTVMSVARTDR